MLRILPKEFTNWQELDCSDQTFRSFEAIGELESYLAESGVKERFIELDINRQLTSNLLYIDRSLEEIENYIDNTLARKKIYIDKNDKLSVVHQENRAKIIKSAVDKNNSSEICVKDIDKNKTQEKALQGINESLARKYDNEKTVLTIKETNVQSADSNTRTKLQNLINRKFIEDFN